MSNRPEGPSVPADVALPFSSRWYTKVLLLLASVVLLTLAFAPWHQFYLAYVGLVPWFFVVRGSRSQWRAFGWSWIGGTAFFIANMWWLAYVTIPGMIALLVYLGLYWGFAALIVRGLGWVRAGEAKSGLATVFGVAVVWSAMEWIRGNLFTGLPWLYLGHTQSPALVMCQVADALGVYGITFWVVTVNAAVYATLIGLPQQWLATGAVALLTIAVGAYGVHRKQQTAVVRYAGPRILVVQPNYPQDNSSGNKGATEEQMVDFHINTTADAIRSKGIIDLACWSETMMPPLNEEYRSLTHGISTKEDEDRGVTLDKIALRIETLCKTYRLNVVAGGLYYSGLNPRTGYFENRRNTAFLFRTGGTLDHTHYDKIHLVPFGEFVPFKNWWGLAWLHNLFMKLSPYDFDYTLTAGSAADPTIFRLNVAGTPGARVVTPICFEDIDAGLCARLIRGGPQGKRADVIVNLTNDGWFKANENAQHMQAAVFRSIENRVPMARTVNTGVSGFITSYGEVTQTVPVRTEGYAIDRVFLDPRYTLYTRVGDLFAWVCTLITGLFVVPSLARWWTRRRQLRVQASV